MSRNPPTPTTAKPPTISKTSSQVVNVFKSQRDIDRNDRATLGRRPITRG
jgi:hypothetical protein